MYSDSIPSTRSLIRSSDDRVHGCHSPTHSVSPLCVRWLTGVRGDQDASLASYALMHLFLVIVFAAFVCCILVGCICLTCIQDLGHFRFDDPFVWIGVPGEYSFLSYLSVLRIPYI